MLKLRRARVVQAGDADALEQELTIELEDGTRRPAVIDTRLHAPSQPGDEVIVNVQALDLGLGSGGFDVVHANLTRGLEGEGLSGAHVMKLNYTSLQHAVHPVEELRPTKTGAVESHAAQAAAIEGHTEECAPTHDSAWPGTPSLPEGRPVAVLALHGQLAPLAWAFAQAAPGRRLGFVQTPGGALSGSHSRTVRELRARGLLAGHLTAGCAYGGEMEAIATPGALWHGLGERGWDAAVCGPGPGIVGSGSQLGHGGMQALDSAHVALALGAPTLIVPRMSNADERPRHRGISHHTLTVLELLLAPVVVGLPSLLPPSYEPKSPYEADPPGELSRHAWRRLDADLEGYERSGLPCTTMGRELREDPLFFASALAGGGALAGMLS